MAATDTNPNESALITALGALGWILRSDSRAERLLALTGLDVETLRQRADDPGLLAATLRFLENYEPDLLACAEALDIEPGDMIAARRTLEDLCDR
ncbi:DUF3572 domain-containing protein [Stakelama sp. CBK3Z-3]|uniref:DUF3572 domain-containing protein n=1 Tax=Stakelama flava TaxID=2860338 RepID=A0ABS6XKA7_9SPHN|nr:DUF3572 domain-containing protein [Stakelama flava]MBW4330610.1 DUF3572 domain-containing protein [Stakelama flava]